MNPFKKGDWVETLAEKGSRWSIGDISYVISVSGEFVDVEDWFGGKRGKKGRTGTQRFHYKELKKFEDKNELER